ncbi:MAG: type II toxin-antitoxin system PemK/MazF family toxin [Clostridiales bacterium]|jgi:mRNA interferase MazF|nr:type II toxin-antitoxin system PemK/MazF family toxin [Clostridiales bacterium]
MVKQGDIIKINFDPQAGHEQAGYRSAVVVSNDFFNARSNLVLVCPITNTDKNFPLHIRLDGRTKITGIVLCEQIKSLDIHSRTYQWIEKMPENLLKDVLDSVLSVIERE